MPRPWNLLAPHVRETWLLVDDTLTLVQTIADISPHIV
jgi:hypothetical protein